jgi:zinc protease
MELSPNRQKASMNRLDNGITVLHRQNTSNAIVAITCLVHPGSTADPDGREGATNLLARLLSRGTATRSSDELAAGLEDLGARFSASASHDYIQVTLQCVREDVPEAMELMADMLLNPTFPIDEMRLERERIRAQIRMRDDRPPSAALHRLQQVLYGTHPYGRPVEGNAESLDQITQIDLVTIHRGAFRPERMIFALVGDVAESKAVALIETHFGAMRGEDAERLSATKNFGYTAAVEEIVRETEGGFVALGVIACNETHPDGPAVDVATAVLGMGMSSRMFSELRDRQSLAYMVGAWPDRSLVAGHIAAYIGSSPSAISDDDPELAGKVLALYGRAMTEEAAERLFAESGTYRPEARIPATRDQIGRARFHVIADRLWGQIDALRTSPVGQEELDRAKAYLIGGYLRRHESNAGQAWHLAYWHLAGVGTEYDLLYPEQIRAVTTRDVMRIANKYFVDPTVVILRPGSPLASPVP